MTFVLQPEHNQATAVITVFKCFFTVRTIDDDVTDAVVCRACTRTKSNIGNSDHKTKTVKTVKDVSIQLVVPFIALEDISHFLSVEQKGVMLICIQKGLIQNGSGYDEELSRCELSC